MKKIFTILFPLFIFVITTITTIHSSADLQEHFVHLLLLGGLSFLFIIYVIRDSIKVKNRLAILTLVLLLSFCTVRVFSCHLLTSNPQDLAHANVINDPCCSAMTTATAVISVAPTNETVTPIEQNPFLFQLPTYIQNLTNKSPPNFTA